MKAVVLLSGGLDSAVLLSLAKSWGRETAAITFDYNQRNQVEVDAAARISSKLHVSQHLIFKIDLMQIGGSSLTDPTLPVLPDAQDEDPALRTSYVPARNSIFLSVALGWAEAIQAQEILYGALAGERNPDRMRPFVRAFNALARVATQGAVFRQEFIDIRAPFLEEGIDKEDVIRLGLELGVPFEDTVTCYSAGRDGLACGICHVCVKRRRAFGSAGLEDPVRYAR